MRVISECKKKEASTQLGDQPLSLLFLSYTCSSFSTLPPHFPFPLLQELGFSATPTRAVVMVVVIGRRAYHTYLDFNCRAKSDFEPPFRPLCQLMNGRCCCLLGFGIFVSLCELYGIKRSGMQKIRNGIALPLVRRAEAPAMTWLQRMTDTTEQQKIKRSR